MAKQAAAAAASDGSAEVPGRRPELPSYPGAAGVLSKKGERPGVCGRLQRRGPAFCSAAPSARQPEPDNSSYSNKPPSRSPARLRLLPRPSYCLDTCRGLRSRPSRRLPSLSPEEEAQEAAGQPGEGKGLPQPRQVQDSEPGGVATSAGGPPPWPWGTRLKTLGKVPALGGGGSTGGRLPRPAVISSTFAIRCLRGAAASPGDHRGCHPRARTAAGPFPESRIPPTRRPPSHPAGHPCRARVADTSTLAFACRLLPACPAVSPAPAGAHEVFAGALVLNFASRISCAGVLTPWIFLHGCSDRTALLSFLRDLGAGPGAERRQGRRAGGGIAETSSSEVHVCWQTILGSRETARTARGCGGAAGGGEAA